MYTNIFSAISISKKYLRVFTNRKTLIFLSTKYLRVHTRRKTLIFLSTKYLRVHTHRKTLIFLSTKYLRVYTNKSVIFLSTKYLHLENLDISKWLHKWKMKTDFVSNNREFVTKSTSVLTSYCHALLTELSIHHS